MSKTCRIKPTGKGGLERHAEEEQEDKTRSTPEQARLEAWTAWLCPWQPILFPAYRPANKHRSSRSRDDLIQNLGGIRSPF